VEKLPRRRRNDSDSSSEGEDEKYPGRQQLAQWLRSGQIQEVAQLLAADDDRWKHAQAMECWLFGLRAKSLPFLQGVLQQLQATESLEGDWGAEEPPMR
jgi:hypothetical protein